MSDTSQALFMLAQEQHPKGTSCPVCKTSIKSLAFKKEKLLFMPCGCVFAVITEIIDKRKTNGNS